MRNQKMHSPLLRFFNCFIHVEMWGVVLLTIIFWSKIPAMVPQHFGSGGLIDSYGKKSVIVVMIIVCFFVYFMHLILMYAISKLNDGNQIYGPVLGKSVTDQETKEGLEIILKMLACIDLFSIGLCIYINFCIATCQNLGRAFEPMIFIGFAGITLYYIKCFLQYRKQLERAYNMEK
ncbi:hypothetical protein lbkm_4020 [Lachnospiraceae bacterium KM106-2]|nr:hypothetical protein lbkm_4020 [Lachnospiraceae bacterium KM106-2]